MGNTVDSGLVIKATAIILTVILTVGVMIPVLQQNIQESETIENEGAGWLRLEKIDGNYSFSVNATDGITVTNETDVQNGTGDTIIYADSNIAIWSQNDTVYLTGEDEGTRVFTTLEDEFTVERTTDGVTVNDGTERSFGSPTYSYVPISIGKYGFFPNGTPVTTTDTLAVGTYAGVGTYGDKVSLNIPLIMDVTTEDDKLSGASWIGAESEEPADEGSDSLGAPAIRIGTGESTEGSGSEPVRAGLGAVATPTYTDGDWGYDLSGSTAYIVSYSGTGGGPITIPSTVGGYTVGYVGKFAGNTNVFDPSITATDLIFPSSLNQIYGRVCNGCSGFTGNLVLPTSCWGIGDSAFANCGFTGTLTLPSNLSTLGNYAFKGCSGFTGALEIPSKTGIYASGMFDGCTGFTSVVLPDLDSVKRIGGTVFNNCTGLTGTLEIPDGMTEIGYKAFYGCSGLTGLVLPDSLTTIRSNVFYGCTGMTGTLHLPSALTQIGEYPFYQCGFTGTLTVPDSVTTLEKGCFNGMDITECVLPDSITTLPQGMFGGCSNLKTVNIPSNCQVIKREAFISCGELEVDMSQFFPDTLTEIGAVAFMNCGKLYGDLVIPEGIILIGSSTFQGCKGLDGVKFPSTLTGIQSSAFMGCSGLKGDLIFPQSLTTVEGSAFYNCTGLTGALVILSPEISMGAYVLHSAGITSLVSCADSFTPTSQQYGTFANSNIKEILNLGDAELTTTTSGLNADSIQDHIDSIGYLAITEYTEYTTKNDPTSILIMTVPLMVLTVIGVGAFVMISRSGRP